MSFSFSIHGIDGLKKALESKTEEVGKKIATAIVDTLTEVKREQVSRAPVDRGVTRQNLFFEHVEGLNFRLFCNVPYAAYIEFGTGRKFQPIAGVDASVYKGGGSGDGKGFYEQILAWVKRKGIAARFSVKTRKRIKSTKADDARERAAAYAIYLSILKNGINPHPFFFTPFLERREQLKRKIEEALK